MTYFTRLFINPTRRGAQKLLSSPQAMHSAVEHGFPPEANQGEGRILWRLDHDPASHRHALFVVSPDKPDFSGLVEQAGWATSPAESAQYGGLLDNLYTRQKWGFKACVNPTKKTRHRKVVPIHGVEDQTEWLSRKLGTNGFSASPDEMAVVDSEVLNFGRRTGGHHRRVRIDTATIRGVLTIDDPEAARSTLINGIGRARAYGCGLITLVPIKGK